LRVFFGWFLLLLKNLSSVVFITDFRHFIRSALCFRVFLSHFKKKLKKKKTKRISNRLLF